MREITLTIDGIKCVGQEGQTILEVAAAAGIHIPVFCHDEIVKPCGACGICVVEAEGNPKLLRSCSTMAADGQVIHTRSERIDRERRITLELLMSDHEGDCRGPCSLRCPAETDCQGYVKQIALGNDREAVRIIKEKIPIPASIGRVCPHPCELDCRRRLVEQPISIAQLKAFAADQDMRSADPYRAEKASATGKTVGIIGGGPAGLTAAYYLALKGHDVTVVDAMPEMGGMLRYGIPEYRLPKKVLAAEVEQIRDLGVKMENNVKLGRDVSFADFRAKYDAVLVAAGAWKGRGVGCTGDDLDGVFDGITFLRKVGTGEQVDVGETVVVVGGGNTAMDACRTAVRVGAKKVYVVYRRSRDEMPAQPEEIEEALEEGVDFHFLTNPAEIIGENGRVTAVKLQKMELGEPDERGRRAPVAIPGEFEILQADSVIAAIGQAADLTGLEDAGLTLNRGNIAADEVSFATSLDGVFAAGDITNRGAGIAIAAIAEANKAAAAIDAYLNGETVSGHVPFISRRKENDALKAQLAQREKLPRAEAAQRSGEERRKDFGAVCLGFTEEQARAEAKRCLECGCHDYGQCKLVKYADEYNVQPDRFAGEKHPGFKEDRLTVIERDQGKCITCNLCVRICDQVAGVGLLGLVGRGFTTVIKPEFRDPAATAVCATCRKCAEHCPTGALKILG